MGKKSAYRFVVEINGELRRILSIREGSNGDLLLTTHTNGTGHWDGKSVREIKESRECLHVSPSSPHSTVHGITVLRDGTTLHRHIVTDAVRNGFFQTLYTRTVIDPSGLPILSTPAKGELIHFPAYKPAKCTMHYAVWFGAPDAQEPPLEGPYSHYFRRFAAFSILIPTCFSPKPSGAFGLITTFSTTTPEKQTAEQAALNQHVGPSIGSHPLAVPGFAIRDFNWLLHHPPGFCGPLPREAPWTPFERPSDFYRTPIG
jgi:hypothetical protein